MTRSITSISKGGLPPFFNFTSPSRQIERIFSLSRWRVASASLRSLPWAKKSLPLIKKARSSPAPPRLWSVAARGFGGIARWSRGWRQCFHELGADAMQLSECQALNFGQIRDRVFNPDREINSPCGVRANAKINPPFFTFRCWINCSRNATRGDLNWRLFSHSFGSLVRVASTKVTAWARRATAVLSSPTSGFVPVRRSCIDQPTRRCVLGGLKASDFLGDDLSASCEEAVDAGKAA